MSKEHENHQSQAIRLWASVREYRLAANPFPRFSQVGSSGLTQERMFGTEDRERNGGRGKRLQRRKPNTPGPASCSGRRKWTVRVVFAYRKKTREHALS